jgi:hypothetical protein
MHNLPSLMGSDHNFWKIFVSHETHFLFNCRNMQFQYNIPLQQE